MEQNLLAPLRKLGSFAIVLPSSAVFFILMLSALITPPATNLADNYCKLAMIASTAVAIYVIMGDWIRAHRGLSVSISEPGLYFLGRGIWSVFGMILTVWFVVFFLYDLSLPVWMQEVSRWIIYLSPIPVALMVIGRSGRPWRSAETPENRK